MSEMTLDALLAAQEARFELMKEESFKFFTPYAKQMDFINLSSRVSESAILAGNQLGKSITGAFIMACHLTGEYPPWWKGKVFTQPVVAWAAGPSGEQVRDVAQEKLCGKPGNSDLWGTG